MKTVNFFNLNNLDSFKISNEKMNFIKGGTDPIGSEEDDFKWQEDQE
jgi:hypothetical protein